jgi:hypothetical protein
MANSCLFLMYIIYFITKLIYLLMVIELEWEEKYKLAEYAKEFEYKSKEKWNN